MRTATAESPVTASDLQLLTMIGPGGRAVSMHQHARMERAARRGLVRSGADGTWRATAKGRALLRKGIVDPVRTRKPLGAGILLVSGVVPKRK
jgi:hypothetical protein